MTLESFHAQLDDAEPFYIRYFSGRREDGCETLEMARDQLREIYNLPILSTEQFRHAIDGIYRGGGEMVVAADDFFRELDEKDQERSAREEQEEIDAQNDAEYDCRYFSPFR